MIWHNCNTLNVSIPWVGRENVGFVFVGFLQMQNITKTSESTKIRFSMEKTTKQKRPERFIVSPRSCSTGVCEVNAPCIRGACRILVHIKCAFITSHGNVFPCSHHMSFILVHITCRILARIKCCIFYSWSVSAKYFPLTSVFTDLRKVSAIGLRSKRSFLLAILGHLCQSMPQL
jgi:hypothetical protein